MNVINTAGSYASTGLDLANTSTSKPEPIDKLAKFAGAVLRILADLSLLPLGALNETIGNATKTLTLFQPANRFREYHSKDGWGTGYGYKSKVYLTLGVTLDAIRVLQSTYVIPTTQHLFTFAAKYPVFQSVGAGVLKLPYGGFIADFAMKVFILENVKNAFIVISSVYSFWKCNAQIKTSTAKLEKIANSIGKWTERSNTLNAYSDIVVKKDLLDVYMKGKFVKDGAEAKFVETKNNQSDECNRQTTALNQKNNATSEQKAAFENRENSVNRTRGIAIESPGRDNLVNNSVNHIAKNIDTFVAAQLDRLEKKKIATQAELDKARRGRWNEIFKITIIVFASLAGPYGLLVKPFIKGAFTTVTAAGATFALYKAVADVKAEEVKADPANKIPSFFNLIELENDDLPQPGDDDQLLGNNNLQRLDPAYHSSDDDLPGIGAKPPGDVSSLFANVPDFGDFGGDDPATFQMQPSEIAKSADLDPADDLSGFVQSGPNMVAITQAQQDALDRAAENQRHHDALLRAAENPL